jgi:hypothetical protein
MSVESSADGKVLDVCIGQGDLRDSILNNLLPAGADKWVSFLTNEEINLCYTTSIKILEGVPFTQDSWNLFCGELFDTIKDKVVEKQAYLVKKFNLEIEDEEIKSEVDDYLKRNKC